MMTWLNNAFWVQQDYLWFLAGFAWLIVAVIWWQSRTTRALPAWIACSAVAGLATACIQMLILVSPVVHLEPNQAPSLRGDMALGVVLALQAAAWWAVGLRRLRGGLVLAGVIGLLVLLGAVWRYDRPAEGTVVIAVMLLGAVAWWSVAGGANARGWRGAMVAAGLAAMLDTTGPVAGALNISQRWYDLSPVGPWAALAHCAAAGAILTTCYHRRRAEQGDLEDRREERWFIGGVAAWLVMGLAFAITVGAWGRRDFEKSALSRVRAAAALMPMENIEALLDARFQIGEVRWQEFSWGARLPTADSKHAETYAAAVSRELTRLAVAHDDVRWVTLSTLREGWLVGAAFANRPLVDLGNVTLFRPASAEDKLAWSEKRGGVSGPVVMSTGETVFARAPLKDQAGRMLGWLDFSFGVNQWVAGQAQPRTLAYLVIALGLIIGRQVVRQRHGVRERDHARADAQAATQASRLKTTFLANVSHELRTPLQSIMGYTELMLPAATARDRERLLAVREHADLMGRLVNDLIDLSAAESGKFHLIERPVMLVDLVVQAAESLRPAAEAKSLALMVDASPEVPSWLHADPQRIRQVVLNLVGNAVKYTDLGHISVMLALVGRDPESAEIELRVTDTGPGVAADAQPHLFEAFHRLEQTAEREGTGLGLAIVAAVSKAMRGSVRVRSDGHTGSTFTARWRLRIAPHAGPTPSGRVPLHGKKILVADDNTFVRDLFVAFLTECGAVCATAGDGLDAIRRLRGEEFDAVVLDLAMPKLDGLATVRRLRHEMPDRRWRIVGVSAHASGAEHDEALAAGMDAFLVKPVSLPELARALAPSIGWIPPTRTFEPIRAHFELRFRADAPAQGAAVAEALKGGRWPEIRAAAHYLKNSADVVGDAELARACAELETAARAGDRKAGDDAWRHCRMALARWLSEPAAN